MKLLPICCFGEEGRAQSFKFRAVVGLVDLAFGALRFEVAVASTASCRGGPLKSTTQDSGSSD